MSTRTVYKVKDLDSDLYMGKGGNWEKKGKTWESIGQLKLTLNNAGYWSSNPSYPGRNEGELPGPNVKIIEIVIQETEDNMSNLDDLIIKQRRYIALGQRFGSAFRDLVERIEAQGQNNQFQWVMVCDCRYDWQNKEYTGDIMELLEICKRMKLKQNKDFKKASAYNERQAAVAFASKGVAMQVRLAMQGKLTSIDIKDYVETNLDEAEGISLNSST